MSEFIQVLERGLPAALGNRQLPEQGQLHCVVPWGFRQLLHEHTPVMH